MTPWITLGLAAGLGLTAAGINPAVLHTPWAGLDSAFRVGHPLLLATLVLTLVLAAVPLELRVGRSALLAAFGLPAIAQFWLWGRAWPELNGAGLLLALAVVSHRRKEPVPWKVWLPLAVAQGFSLWLSAPPQPALLLTAALTVTLGWFSKTEAVAVLGLAAGGALALAWLS